MAKVRFSHLDDFVLKDDGKVGIGTLLPTTKVEVIGNVRAANIKSEAGITTFVSLDGFLNQNLETNDNLTVESGDSGTISGEIIIGAGTTLSVSIGATTGQGRINSLKVSNTFTPPIGGTNERPSAPKPGTLYYNKDFKTIEYWDGNFWRQVDYTTKRGRGLFGGGQPGPSKKIDSLEIMTLGNGVEFGDLIAANANKSAYSNNIRAIFVGGGSAQNDMDYVTIASEGNGVDFGNLSVGRAYSATGSSQTRGICLGGWAGSNPPSNVIDYVEIMTTGNAVDFGDMFTGRYTTSGFSSPTRTFAYSGVNNNNTTIENSIEMVTTASKGNATDFGDAATGVAAAQNGSSSSTRGIMGGGNMGNIGPTYVPSVQYLTMASSGSASIFGDLTVGRQRPGGASTQTRAVFYGGKQSSGTDYSVIDYVTIPTTGNAADFGDVADTANYTKGGCSDSHGGLGGF